MARLTRQQWEQCRIDYEVKKMSYTELENKYNVNRSNISRRATKERWNQEKTQQIIAASVDVERKTQQINEETQHLNATTQRAIQKEVSDRLELEGIFMNAVRFNQAQANKLLAQQVTQGVVELGGLNMHSQITARNKETALGKMPDTAIQVNNTVNATPAIADLTDEELAAELKKYGIES
ncbi:MAG: hypothetical protein Q4G42_05210 [Neisseria sp.]|nr:hypothetical protein [Neisseria sp.]